MATAPAEVGNTAFRAVIILFDEHLREGLVGVNSRDRGLLYVDDVPALAPSSTCPKTSSAAIHGPSAPTSALTTP
ncbi:hypothetical protein [Streptomyces prunicolor]|uniref:hypothetical protein n=1 Tax=Streptomyces prunicolor TaxID=67348 RepID=UPI000368508E|nr:hypothetical protein [Streptomyces prunicolor]